MSELIDELLAEAGERMTQSVQATHTQFGTVRTGRASPTILDRVMVDYYGAATPLKQLATIGVPEPRLLTIQPYDPSAMKAIEKAIQESDLGLQPSNDGKTIRLPIPQLTEERRKELVRNGEVGDDDERRSEQEVQKLTDAHTKSIDELLKHKEAEIMEV